MGAVAHEQERSSGQRAPGSSGELSMWSCRRCTLENPLQETTCLACGGSRLCSIGEIEPPPVEPPKQPMNLLRGEEQEKGMIEEQETKEGVVTTMEPAGWHCVVCTLENEPLAYYCDACNTQSPLKTIKDLKEHRSAGEAWGLGEVARKVARYFAIFCFLAIITTSLFNMLICLYSTVVSLGSMVPTYPSPTAHEILPAPSMPPLPSPPTSAPLPSPPSPHQSPPYLPELPEALPEEDTYSTTFTLEEALSFTLLGLSPLLLAVLSPLLLVVVSSLQAPAPAPRVPMPRAPASAETGLKALLQDPIFTSGPSAF